jgi:hypothetical protein
VPGFGRIPQILPGGIDERPGDGVEGSPFGL